MQQKILTADGPVDSNVTMPGSKSVTYHALLLAALADGVSEISGMQINDDTKLFIDALNQLGIPIQLDEKNHACIITGMNGKFPQTQATLWCGNDEVIAHFLLTACAATAGVYHFDGVGDLRELSLRESLNLLSCQGAQITPSNAQNMPFTLLGADTFEGGEIIFNDSISPELISALLMIAPHARSPFHFTLTDSTTFHAANMTCAMMAEFGVLVRRIHKGQFMIPVPQRYQARDFAIEPNFSIARNFLAAAAVTGGKITLQPMKQALSKPAHVKFLAVLEKMGCKVSETPTGLTVQGPEELKGVDIDMPDFSDAFMVFAAIASFANSPTRILHIESEQIAVMKDELTKLNIQVEAGANWMKIHPSLPKGNLVQAHHDPHLAMALAIIGLKTPDVRIKQAECVATIYPDFFSLWNQLAESVIAEA